jgi:hypothetical protein
MERTERFRVIYCEAEGCEDMAVIWDNLEQQVLDVIDARTAAKYADDSSLWDAPTPADGGK